MQEKYFFSPIPPPSPNAINPEARPLGTYETKMAARTSQRSILTILQEIRDCKQSTRDNINLKKILWFSGEKESLKSSLFQAFRL